MVNSKDIPKYLKENAKFCNWKYETRDGRLTKVPYNPHTNNKASVNNANTFTDFNSVVNGLDIYDGIGIRVDGKIIAIDLDHCIEDGNLCSWSEEIVSHFHNSALQYYHAIPPSTSPPTSRWRNSIRISSAASWRPGGHSGGVSIPL